MQDLSLDFTLPGYDIELIVSSRLRSRMAHAIDIVGQPDILVSHRNVHRYIDRVLDVMLAEGVRILVTAFREGFSRVFQRRAEAKRQPRRGVAPASWPSWTPRSACHST
jgi:E3 ubiquitin-protein ligase TRIP12